MDDNAVNMDDAEEDGLRSGNEGMVKGSVQASKRNFNENDVLGNLDRDDDQNLVIPFNEVDRGLLDKAGRKINQAGFLVDEDGNIVNQAGDIIFKKEDLDDNGELPLKVGLERYNFNPFDILGNFDNTTNVPNPEDITDMNGEENLRDINGRKVNKHGYLVDDDGNIVNRRGRKIMDKCYLNEEGDFPEMYNMRAKAFKMTSIMGEL